MIAKYDGHTNIAVKNFQVEVIPGCINAVVTAQPISEQAVYLLTGKDQIERVKYNEFTHSFISGCGLFEYEVASHTFD